MGLFDIFKKSGPADDSKTRYFHEDDYRQIELVSRNDLPELEKQCQNIYGFTKRHFDGTSFTSCFNRSGITSDLDEYEIKVVDLENILRQIGFYRAHKVTTGYSSHVEVKKDMIAYYEQPGGAIFFEDFNGVVGNIWLTHLFRFDQDKLADALHEIGTKWDLILMDWNKLLVANLADRTAIVEYLTDGENW